MQAVKTHWAVQRARAFSTEGEMRSLCGRAAPTVIDIENILTGANLTRVHTEVTCKRCTAMLAARPELLTRE